MAKQAGFKFIGKLGGLTGFIRGGKFFVRAGEDAQAEKKRRNNNPEFGRASAAGKLIRNACGVLLFQSKDGSRVNRLTSAMQGLIALDKYHRSGERKVLDEHLHLLKGFEFNKNAEIGKIIRCSYEHSIDGESGIMKVFFKPFIPKESIDAPYGSTHFKIAAEGASVNIDANKCEHNYAESGYWGVNTTDAIGIELVVSLPLEVNGAKMLYLGVEFFKEAEGVMEKMKEKNGVRLVDVRI